MYETHKLSGDSSEVFATSTPTLANPNQTYYTEENDCGENDWWSYEGEWDPSYSEGVMEVALCGGSITLMKPKKPTKPRNTPGIHDSPSQCAIRNFSFTANRKGKGGGGGVGLPPMWRSFSSLEGLSSSLPGEIGPQVVLAPKR